MDPVTFGAIAATGVATSRSAPEPPPEWKAQCDGGFELERSGPAPSPDGLLIDGAPARIALALRRTGAAYAGVHVEAATGSWLRPLITGPGVYRVRQNLHSPACDVLLDRVIAAWSDADKTWRQASSCLTAERMGDYVPRNDDGGSEVAPYFVRGVAHERNLHSGFKMQVFGQAVVERATGREIARQMRSAQLSWRVPNMDHLYWGAVRFCGPEAGQKPSVGILPQRIFGSQ